MRPLAGAAAREGLVQDWDDDAEYPAAVGRSWLMVLITVMCVLVLLGITLIGVLGVVGVSEVLSIVSG